MLEELITYDKELFLFLNNLGSAPWDGLWLAITNKYTSIPLYLLLLFLSYKKFGLQPMLLVLLTAALLIAATDQIANLFKYNFERLRPCHDETIFDQMRLVKAYCGGRFGYFSAHAANAFAAATFFGLLLVKKLKWLPFFLLVWALFVAYSRIYIGVHYPLDVITGISIGMLLGCGFYRLFVLLKGKLKI